MARKRAWYGGAGINTQIRRHERVRARQKAARSRSRATSLENAVVRACTVCLKPWGTILVEFAPEGSPLPPSDSTNLDNAQFRCRKHRGNHA